MCCSKQPTFIKPSTPPLGHAEATILSSPMHSFLPDNEHAQAWYTHTIFHPEIMLEATEAVVLKLMQHL